MAFVYAVLAFALGSHFSEALWQSTKPKKLAVQLPETSAMNQGSQHVIDELATQVSSLQTRLNQVNQKGKDSLQTQKAAFEQILAQQAHENILLKSQNEGIIGEIQNHRSNSSKWRKEAENMALACNRQKQELHQLQTNMTFAQEFVHQTLNATEKMLEAPELRFLEELMQHDEADKKDKLHASHLMEIAGEHEDGIQMLQIDVGVTEAPQELLQSLLASIEDLSRQQNQSLLKMKANFDVAYHKGVEVRKSLLDEQTKLNATRAYERSLNDRLHLAAEHLAKTHDELTHKLDALRVFHARLGGGSATPVHKDAVSLIQFSQKILPETSILMREPQHVQDKLKSQIAMLAAGLAEKHQNASEAIERLKANYESQLNSQAGENERMQRKNKNLSEYAESLDKNNQALREEAKWLEAGNGQLEAELKNLKVNISTAQEFIRIALESSNEMLENASELNVLISLEAQDAAARSVRIHQERLEQVSKSASLLQLSAAISPKDTHDVLESLMASLTDLSQQQNISEASLKASFEEEFNIGTKKHQSLAEEQANLNKTIADREELRERLRSAVHHLHARRDLLVAKTDSLRTYMKKMGYAQGSNKTISLLGVKHETHESKTAAPEGKAETAKAVNKVEQRDQSRRAKPVKEALSASTNKDHGSHWDRGQGRRSMPKYEHESASLKHAKHVEQKTLTRASEQTLAPNGTEAGVASGAPHWLAPISTNKDHGSHRDRGQGRRSIPKYEHESSSLKHAKHLEQKALTRASEQTLAPNGTEAGVASGAPRWLAPIKKGINWLRR